MSGIEGSGKIKALMAKCREQAPTEFAGIQVAQTEDFKELTRTLQMVKQNNYKRLLLMC